MATTDAAALTRSACHTCGLAFARLSFHPLRTPRRSLSQQPAGHTASGLLAFFVGLHFGAAARHRGHLAALAQSQADARSLMTGRITDAFTHIATAKLFVHARQEAGDLAAGRILIDGQDIAHVSQDSLRAQVGMVTQHTSLLRRWVRDNILYGRPGWHPWWLSRRCWLPPSAPRPMTSSRC